MPWRHSAAALLFHHYPKVYQRTQKQNHETSIQSLGCYNKEDGSGCCSNEMIKGNHGQQSRSSQQSCLLAKCRVRKEGADLDCYLS